MEEWKTIDNFIGYEISNMGRVRNKKSGTIRKFAISNGYYVIKFYDKENKKYILKRIHRLVAEYFIENDDPENKTTVNHKRGNKLDNRYTELEWLSILDNCLHARDNNLSPGVKLNKDIVKEIRRIKLSQKIKNVTLAKIYNVSYTCIFRVVHNMSWKDV
jgi:hypothetical protein